MDRTKIAALIARRAGISKKDANSLCNQIVSLVEREIRKDGQLKLPGAGSFALAAQKKKSASKKSKRKVQAAAKRKAFGKKAALKKAAAKKTAKKAAPKRAAPKPAPPPAPTPSNPAASNSSYGSMEESTHGSGSGRDE